MNYVYEKIVVEGVNVFVEYIDEVINEFIVLIEIFFGKIGVIF